MYNKYYSSTNEEIELNIIKDIYNEIISHKNDIKKKNTLVKELLSKQKADGSWTLIKWDECDADTRVTYGYIPTYYATAALMFADSIMNYSADSKEKAALSKGLNAAIGRGLSGHGFESTRGRLNALEIYKNAGMYSWIKKDCNKRHPFSLMVEDIVSEMRSAVKNGKTFSDWNEDFKTDFEREISAYETANCRYVWYACYGSNINKERFMEYINNCTDKTPPIADRPFCFDHNIYFAKHSSKWQGGKAFLDDTVSGKAYGRIYKITKEQYEELKLAEGRDYTKQLDLGTVDGCEVYSFTDTQRNNTISLPSDEYFRIILEGLKDCYDGILKEKEIVEYLVRRVFPKNTFEVVRAIRKSTHYMTNANVKAVTGLDYTDVIEAVVWLTEHGVLRQDNRSVCAGHGITEESAYFYTVERCWARGLVDEMIASLG